MKSIIGRFLLVCVIIISGIYNKIFLGLVFVLSIIVLTNKKFFIEGMDSGIIGDDNSNSNSNSNSGKIKVFTNENENVPKDKPKLSDLKNNSVGVDRISLTDNIKAKKSSELPVSKNMFKSTDDVSAYENTKEGFFGSCSSCSN
jgi:hypothetical protein